MQQLTGGEDHGLDAAGDVPPEFDQRVALVPLGVVAVP